jgi:hypothetical protein
LLPAAEGVVVDICRAVAALEDILLRCRYQLRQVLAIQLQWVPVVQADQQIKYLE